MVGYAMNGINQAVGVVLMTFQEDTGSKHFGTNSIVGLIEGVRAENGRDAGAESLSKSSDSTLVHRDLALGHEPGIRRVVDRKNIFWKIFGCIDIMARKKDGSVSGSFHGFDGIMIEFQRMKDDACAEREKDGFFTVTQKAK